MATAAAAEHGAARAVRKHCRNHSYDQIYKPNNIKIDQEFHNKLNKHRTVPSTNAAAAAAATSTSTIENDVIVAKPLSKEYLENRMLSKNEMTTQPTGLHSRTNSKDLNKSSFLSSLVDDAANILRHRRTNSKDLNRILNPMPSTSEAGALTNESQATQFHKRNVSLPRNDLPEERSADVAQVLLLNNNENSDMQTRREDEWTWHREE